MHSCLPLVLNRKWSGLRQEATVLQQGIHGHQQKAPAPLKQFRRNGAATHTLVMKFSTSTSKPT
jgi:hypothetical protein